MEVHVEAGRGDADLVGDLPDRGALVAVGDENALGRAQDFGATQVAVALGFAGRADGPGQGIGHGGAPLADKPVTDKEFGPGRNPRLYWTRRVDAP